MEEKLEAVETQNVGQIRNLTDQLSNQTAQIEQLEAQIRELQEEKVSLYKEVDESKNEKNSLQQKVRDASGNNTAFQQQLDSLHATNEKMRLAFLDKVTAFDGLSYFRKKWWRICRRRSNSPQRKIEFSAMKSAS